MADCKECGAEYPDARKVLGYSVCLDCGETVQSVKARLAQSLCLQHKQGYVLVRSRDDVRQLNTGKVYA